MKKIMLYLFIICFPISLLTQNLSWEPLNLDVGLNIKEMLQDSTGRIIIQSEKGIFIINNFSNIKRIDDLLSDSIKVSSIAIDTSNSIYVSTIKNGVLKYNELLNEWQNYGTFKNSISIKCISISKFNRAIVCSSTNILFELNSKTLSWDTIVSPNGVLKLNFQFMKYDELGNLLFKCFGDNIWKLKKGQYKWSDYVYTTNYSIDVFYKNGFCYFPDSTNKIFIGKDSIYDTNNNPNNIWNNTFKLSDGINKQAKIIKCFSTNKNEIIVITNNYGVYFSNYNIGFFAENNSGLNSLKIKNSMILNDNSIIVNVDSLGLFHSSIAKSDSVNPKIQWQEKDNYKELNDTLGKLVVVKLNSKNDKVFIVDEIGVTKKYDLITGKLEKRFSITIPEISINTDTEEFVEQRREIIGLKSFNIINLRWVLKFKCMIFKDLCLYLYS